jgi:hypothetical protein
MLMLAIPIGLVHLTFVRVFPGILTQAPFIVGFLFGNPNPNPIIRNGKNDRHRRKRRERVIRRVAVAQSWLESHSL